MGEDGALTGTWGSAGFRLVCLVTPLLIGLVWGAVFDDDVYATLRQARSLVSERGSAYALLPAGEHALFRTPLYTLVSALCAWIGAPLPQVGLVLSTLGWGVAAVAMYETGRTMRRPVGAVVSAALISFNPLVVWTLGGETSWAVAGVWVAVAALAKKRWIVQTIALLFVLGVRFDLSTLVTAILLLVGRWSRGGRFPLWPGLVVAAVTGCWCVSVSRRMAAPPAWSGLIEGEWHVRQLVRESEIYWVFLPLSLWGGLELLTAMGRGRWIGLLWGALSLLVGGRVGGALLVSVGVFLAGVGGDAISLLVGRGVRDFRRGGRRGLVQPGRVAMAASIALVIGLPLGVAQLSSLWQRYQVRPVTRHDLERRAGSWLRAHSEPTDVILGSERVGYWADRVLIPWDGGRSDPAELASLMQAVSEDPPDYCVSVRSIAWDHVMRTGWFEDSYAPLQRFESPYTSVSPVTVWGYRLRAFDSGSEEPLPLNIHLPGEVDLVGYKYRPDRIQPGEAVYVTLYMQAQATRVVTDVAAIGPFQTVVRITSPQDGVAWAQRDTGTYRNVPEDWWRGERLIVERFVLTTTAEIPVGAYHVEVAVVDPDSKEVLPIYERDNTAALDRVVLGYVVVPWRGSMDAATPVGADLGEEIRLLGFEAPDSVTSGAGFDVTLYWEARQPPAEDYVVFVHLLDGAGQLVAGHDGPPLEGRYPTQAWVPGEVVADVHRLALGADVAAGTYRLQVGMYRWPSLERLAVWDGEGREQPHGALVLQD
ncbi:MAG: hypothetical protein DRI48_09300, partial [Chloroflexi bacterium]